MSQPAARVSDMHTCPMVTPAVPPVPHVGGPILPPGAGPRALIGGLPAARVGDMCTCVGPPDSIVKGSLSVLIAGMPAARMGDLTAHGGVIAAGFPQVLIGDSGGGGGGGGAAADATLASNGTLQHASLAAAAENGTPFCEACEKARRFPAEPAAHPTREVLTAAAVRGAPFCAKCEAAKRGIEPPPAPGTMGRSTLANAAESGAPFCEECSNARTS